jgi:hypothetical protein
MGASWSNCDLRFHINQTAVKSAACVIGACLQADPTVTFNGGQLARG